MPPASSLEPQASALAKPALWLLCALAALLPACGTVRVVGTKEAPAPAVSPAKWLSGRAIGDGGPALTASLDRPSALALGPRGEVYVAERERVRVIESGLIRSLPGTGSSGSVASPRGVAVSPTSTVFVTDEATEGLYTWNTPLSTPRRLSASQGMMLASTLDNVPIGAVETAGAERLQVDPGSNLAWSELIGQRVRLISRVADPDPDRALRVRTVAGTWATAGYSGDGGLATLARLSSPQGLAFDRFGNLLIADSANHRLRLVSATSGFITTLAGTDLAGVPVRGFSGDGGAAVSARFDSPEDVSVAASGAMLVADTGNHRVRSIDPATLDVQTVAGTGSDSFSGDGQAATAAALGVPAAVLALPTGGYLVADRANHRVRRIAADGTIATVAGASGNAGVLLAEAHLSRITALATDPQGRLLMADSASIYRTEASTSSRLELVAGDGRGGREGDGLAALAARIHPPSGLATDSSGNLFLSDPVANVVRRVDALTGRISTVAGTPATTAFIGDDGPAVLAGLYRPRGLAVDSSGNLYIADEGHHAVRVVDRYGVIFTLVNRSGVAGSTGDGGDARAARLNAPRDVAVDPIRRKLLIADTGNGTLRSVPIDGSSQHGTISSTSTALTLNRPMQVDFDASGRLAVLDHDVTGHLTPYVPGSGTAGTLTAVDVSDALVPSVHTVGVLPDASMTLTADRRAVMSDGKRLVYVEY